MLDREIKFRGKAEYYNDWLYGNLVQTREKGAYIFPLDAPDSVDRYSVLENTVSQYTGVKDKNGNEVYEGDILLTFTRVYTHKDIEKGIVYKIVWSHRSSAWILKNSTGEFLFVSSCIASSFEVIGNIYDNPELLEVNR